MCNNGVLSPSEIQAAHVRALAKRKVKADQVIQALMLTNTNGDYDHKVDVHAAIINARRERALVEAEIDQYVTHGVVDAKT